MDESGSVHRFRMSETEPLPAGETDEEKNLSSVIARVLAGEDVPTTETARVTVMIRTKKAKLGPAFRVAIAGSTVLNRLAKEELKLQGLSGPERLIRARVKTFAKMILDTLGNVA